MLQPKRTKFRKAHKGRIHGFAKGGTELNFGSYGLKAVKPERVTARQIEAARRAITRHLRRTLFPVPLAPIIKFVLPFSNFPEISKRTCLSLNDFDMFLISIIIIPELRRNLLLK